MTRDYQADAAKFMQGLPDRIGDGIDVPSIFAVRDARAQEFPILDAGVKARSAALRDNAGKEYGIVTVWGGDTAINRETRMAGKADGTIVLERPGMQSFKVPFLSEPHHLTLGGVVFSPDQEDEMANHLDGLLKTALS